MCVFILAYNLFAYAFSLFMSPWVSAGRWALRMALLSMLALPHECVMDEAIHMLSRGSKHENERNAF